jgi:UDP-N-acetylmuramate dehydrogenase
VGGVKISSEHGNFILNTGSGTASDVVRLIQLARQRVKDETGLVLEEEIEYLGF